jgi:hypothetical protein
MTMINRAAPDASPRLDLTDVEITLIDRLAAPERMNSQAEPFLTI